MGGPMSTERSLEVSQTRWFFTIWLPAAAGSVVITGLLALCAYKLGWLHRIGLLNK